MAGESLQSGVRVFTKSLKQSYEHLGMVLVTSIIWFALAFMPTAFLISFAYQAPCVVTFLAVAIEIVFLAGPVTTAMCSVAGALIRSEAVYLREIWSHFRRNYSLSVKVSATMLVIIFVLIVDVVFFLSSSKRIVQWLSVPWLYLILYWAMMTTYIFPLMAHQRVRLLKILQRAALLVLDNLVVTIMVMLEALLIVAASGLLLFPVVFLLGGVLALLLATALAEVLEKYGE